VIIFSNIYLTLILFLVGGVILQYVLAGILFVISCIVYLICSMIKLLIEELINWIKEKIKVIFNDNE
jgi:hypothetical protein